MITEVVPMSGPAAGAERTVPSWQVVSREHLLQLDENEGVPYRA